MRPSITPVFIVKNEEAFLPQALASLAPFGDVMATPCVYDTGSADGTRDLARAAGARVTSGYWDDDFARAKNDAVTTARTPWVLSLDADERIDGDPRLLAAAIVSAERQELDSLIVEIDDVRDREVVNTAPTIRLFRRDIAHFRNRIHEVVKRLDGEHRRAARLPREVLRLVHVGYGPAAAMERRRERNSRIGELEVEEARRQATDAVRLVEALVNRGRSRGARLRAPVSPPVGRSVSRSVGRPPDGGRDRIPGSSCDEFSALDGAGSRVAAELRRYAAKGSATSPFEGSATRGMAAKEGPDELSPPTGAGR